MSDAADRKPRGQSRGRAAAQAGGIKLAALTFVFVIASNASGLPQARGQDTLSWKFREGDVLKYTNEQTNVLSFKAMGKLRKQKRSQSLTYTWSIKGVSAAGVADVTQRIERVTMKIEAPPYMTFEYDSSTPATDVPEPFEGEVQQLKAVPGAEFSFKMKPSGEIESIKFPDATLKKLRDGLPQDGRAREEFSEQHLKDSLVQQSPAVFPEGPLEPGKSWASKPTRIPLPLGTIILDQSFTFQGPDPNDANLLQITMEGRIGLEPGSNVTAKIRAQESKGTVTFDKQAGRMVSSRGTQKTEIGFLAQGEEADQTTETTSVLTLVP
jgi:hypothetical protein